jgi:ketosteroid isomerase-like protein
MGARNEKRRRATSADETRIGEILSEHEAGYRTKDADRIVGHYAPEIVLFDLAPPLRRRATPQCRTPVGGTARRGWKDSAGEAGTGRRSCPTR